MAKETVKLLITQNTAIAGKFVERGTVVEIDPENAQDKATYALLAHAGRVAAHTPENEKRLKAEMEMDKKAEARSATGTDPARAIAEGVAAALAVEMPKAIIAALVECGLVKAPKAKD